MARRILFCILILTMPMIALAEQAESPAPLESMAQLPSDPVWAAAYRVDDLADGWDQMIESIASFVPEAEQAQVDQAMEELDAQLGLSLRDDLFAHVGPELALSMDVMPLDLLAGQMMSETPEGIAAALGGIGVIVQVHNVKALAASLVKLAAAAEIELLDDDGMSRWILPDAADGPYLFHAFGESSLAIGFSRDWVAAALGNGERSRLGDGDDFASLAHYVLEDATWFSYLNLPKIQLLARESGMLKGALASQPDMAAITTLLELDDLAPTGFISSGAAREGGHYRASFGPAWSGGGVATMGIVAAIAVPNFVNSLAKARSKRTMADLRSINLAIQSYAVDENRYPSTDSEIVPVESIRELLEPMYIHTLPLTDAWEHPLFYWSDGTNFGLASNGKDGVADGPYDEVEPGPAYTFDSDVIIINGDFVQWLE